MNTKPSNLPLLWSRFDVDPGWVPLHRAPFAYRICSGEDWCQGWEDGTPDRQLASWLRQSGIRDATINSSIGEIMLLLPEGSNGPFNFPVCFHPAEFDPDEIRDEHLRRAVSEKVALVWSRMQDEFRLAVDQRRCVVVARAGSILNSFTPIDPKVFRYFEVVDWQQGEAVNAAGEKLFMLHAAPPHLSFSVQPEPQAHQQLGALTERICNYLRCEYPAGKPSRLSYEAIAALFNASTGLNVSESWIRQKAQEHLDWPRKRKKA
jgi:hypothetical protein